MLLQTKAKKAGGITEALNSLKIIPGEPWQITPELYKAFEPALRRYLEDTRQKIKIVEMKIKSAEPETAEFSRLQKELSTLHRESTKIDKQLQQLKKDTEGGKVRPATKQDQELMDRIIKLMVKPQKLK